MSAGRDAGRVGEQERLRSELERARGRERELEDTRRAMLFLLEDVNEGRRRIEQANREWELTFDAVSDPLLVHDAEGRILRANRAYADRAGAPAGDLRGQPFWTLFPRMDADAARRRLAEDRAEITTDDGAVFVAHAFPVADADRRFTILMLHEITERKRAERALRESRDRLHASLEGLVDAMASTLEARDAYTAGHQRRVAELAGAMAVRLGLGDEQVTGVRLGAAIHDLGKINVPVELLTKPGRLSPPEYALIKEHARIGFGILAGIDFPWPVADIAHQHHERLDGSGYPRGLRGDEILSEARIVAVADVVEAMASHRPYRAARGVDAALAEIRSGRGTLYDPDAVDACEAVFAAGDFAGWLAGAGRG